MGAFCLPRCDHGSVTQVAQTEVGATELKLSHPDMHFDFLNMRCGAYIVMSAQAAARG
jgi:hypothetical protein